MKKHKLKIIIALMTAAVVGLIIMQIYWISNMVRVEEEQFKRNVNTAMNEASEMLAKKDAAEAIIKKISGGKTNVAFFVQHDSSITARRLEPSRKMVRIESNSNNFKYEIKYFGKNDSLPHTVRSNVIVNGGISHTPRDILYERTDSSSKKHRTLVQNVFTEMVDIDSKKKIEERVNAEQLGKLLSEQFRNRGIGIDYYFCVNKVNKDSLTLVKPGSDINELKKSDYRSPLFPTEIFSDENQLVVYFPNQKTYLIKSMVGMLGLSLVFFLIIVGVFYKTVEMFLKQKKITDVKNDLINNITHEFKTPISTISLACEALNEPDLLSDKNSVSRYSKIIKEENTRLKTMVETLLNTAAMEKDEITLNYEEVEVHEIITATAEKFSETIKSKNGKIILKLEAQESKTAGDEFHLINIISNLIDNAIKYNERAPEILISSSNDTRNIYIVIKDNGIGIPKDNLSKIFETFFRVSNGNIQNVRGNGIGLSYTKKIVEAHGGEIFVESEIDNGSEFAIRLPLKKL